MYSITFCTVGLFVTAFHFPSGFYRKALYLDDLHMCVSCYLSEEPDLIRHNVSDFFQCLRKSVHKPPQENPVQKQHTTVYQSPHTSIFICTFFNILFAEVGPKGGMTWKSLLTYWTIQKITQNIQYWYSEEDSRKIQKKKEKEQEQWEALSQRKKKINKRDLLRGVTCLQTDILGLLMQAIKLLNWIGLSENWVELLTHHSLHWTVVYEF